MNIYVGNLSWNLKDQDLLNLFASHGEVASAKIVTDKFTGRSKGFGFVEMPNDEQAQAAIAALNGTEVDGRSVLMKVVPSPKAVAAVATKNAASAAAAAVTVVVTAAAVAIAVETAVVTTVRVSTTAIFNASGLVPLPIQ
jgi:hypothetical protein